MDVNMAYNLPIHPVLLMAIVIAVYFLPIIIAAVRNMRHAVAISVLTVVAGWTFVGWVVALVWACMDKPEPKKEE
ncbi:superinfection immunity protein [Vreelandella titanicae]|uniref:superinfection immunity protein n=1 Tax=Vreelandella titanicae TaxID=664683 RepID=UPI003CFEB3BD|tara:strand:- start:10170 stop:10394 length:225 start_codon:yes stop_codon:yes gene_type:complete